MTDLYDSDSSNRSDRLVRSQVDYGLKVPGPPYRRISSPDGDRSPSASFALSACSRKRGNPEPSPADWPLIKELGGPYHDDIAAIAKLNLPMIEPQPDEPPGALYKHLGGGASAKNEGIAESNVVARQALELLPSDEARARDEAKKLPPPTPPKPTTPKWRQDFEDRPAPVEPSLWNEPRDCIHHHPPSYSPLNSRTSSENNRRQHHHHHHRNNSLPPLQSAVGEVALAANNAYNLPSLPASSPTLPGNELTRERRLSGSLPRMRSSLLFSPVSPEEEILPSPVMQSPQLPLLRPIIPSSEPYPIRMRQAQAGDNSYPMPYDQASTMGFDGQPLSAQSSSSPAGTYKCQYPGCTAPPFQTQYLLKYVHLWLGCRYVANKPD